jgi:hemolysin III
MRGAFQHEDFSTGEEIAHAVTHGVGALASVAGLVLLIVQAAQYGGARLITGVTIFGSTLVLLYLSSTLFHALTPRRAKRVFQLLDYSAIYLLIAGTYTPFTLTALGGGWGWSLFGVVWGLAAIGIIYESVFKRPSNLLSLFFYLVMGWLMVIAIKPLISALPTGGLILLAAGGICYSGGAVFYAWRGFPYHHMVWHLFVMGGSACHYFAVLLYVVPLE